ncbi:hypothetical protein CRUP_004938 [Coryphaenoides rupestris]|nr:hypothetical protein CRUP_004938 [Coryphaenoides rupestris]
MPSQAVAVDLRLADELAGLARWRWVSQSPTATLQSTNTQTQSSSSSSGDGSLFRQRGSQAAQPDETGRVPPYVDFSQFYRLWGSDHAEAHGTLGPQ